MLTSVQEILRRFKEQKITRTEAAKLLENLGSRSSGSARLMPAVPASADPSGIGSEDQRDRENFYGEAEADEPQIRGVSSEAHQVMSFREQWEVSELLPPPRKLRSLLCFLSESRYREQAVRDLSASNPQVEIITVQPGSFFEKRSSQEYLVPRGDPSSYVRVLFSIASDYQEIEAAAYLWALADGSLRDFQPLIYLVQAVAASGLKLGRLLLLGSFQDSLERCYLESWIAFARSLKHVLLETQVAVIALEGERSDWDWIEILAREAAGGQCETVLYASTGRQVLRTRPFTPDMGSKCLRHGGTYLITGGAGGLGLLVAEHFARTYAANLVLIGRSPLDDSNKGKLDKLEALGGQAIYIQADVCSLSETRDAVVQARARFGPLHGLIHAAALVDGSSLLKKDLAAFERVLRPKIEGTLILEEVLRDELLDFVCYFSSSSAILGDFGACDYAAANRFLTAYGEFGPGLVRRIAIAWPLWREGRMGFDLDSARDLYLQASGQRMLETAEGMAWLELALQHSGSMLVIAGLPEPVHRFLGIETEKKVLTTLPPGVSIRHGRTAEMTGWTLDQCVKWELRKLASGILGLEDEHLSHEENLANLGFDSINLAEYARQISWRYGLEISPSTFFSHPSLSKLSQHFTLQHRPALEAFYAEYDASVGRREERSSPASLAKPSPVLADLDTSAYSPGVCAEGVGESVAIIGLSGRFPQARTVDEMWRILVEARSAVTEIPAERFDWRAYYDYHPRQPSKTDCKWMGVLPGVSEFDASFFEISPRDAEQMDPRQRLLLEQAWRALEDAGYGPQQLNSHNVGMFVGVEQGNYQSLLGSGVGTITSNHDGVLAARLSYFLDLHGPAMAINTACSSGLVAVHQACMSILTRECDTAVAAAANLLLLPQSFVAMSQAGMLSPDGKCYVFDRRANGMVPGEAVVAVVLKRLASAEADGDPIYAVIRSSGINYDGKTNGITAPSGTAQSKLLSDVYQRANVNPRDIDYVIAHGTATKLGDPVEIKALDDAFKTYTSDSGFCALTSTKSNFGHTFAASGLLSLTALVQALHHETIPGSLHFEQQSDYIDWETTPFYVNRSNAAWPKKDNRKRLGAVSAFGMSGTNAHLVVESYDQLGSEGEHQEYPCYLLVFSAKTQSALMKRVQDLLDWMQSSALNRPSLREISYTLLCGRQHFTHRCAMLVRDHEHLIRVCRQFTESVAQPNIYSNVVSRRFAAQKLMLAHAEDLLRQLPSLRKEHQPYQDSLHLLADLYCQGYEPDWVLMFADDRPRRIHLPTYPFDREQYWPEPKREEMGRKGKAGVVRELHPLLHENTSDLGAQRFSSWLRGDEFFLSDHVIGGRKVLPGVAYLEMARAAVERSTRGVGGWVELRGVVWQRPVVVEDKLVRVDIELHGEEQGEIRYEIYSGGEGRGERVVHGEGRAVRLDQGEAPRLDVAGLQRRCTGEGVEGERCYEEFARAGLSYGAGHRSVKRLQVGEDETGKAFVLGELELPAAVAESGGEYGLHPGVLDGALQTSLELRMGGTGERKKPGLPFALERVRIYGKSCRRSWVWVREGKGSGEQVRKLDIDVSDEQGEVWIRLEGFSDRTVTAGKQEKEQQERSDQGVLLLERIWKEAGVEAEQRPEVGAELVVLLCGMEQVREELAGELGVSCEVVGEEGSAERVEQGYAARARRLLALIQEHMRRRGSGPVLLQLVASGEGSDAVSAGLWGLMKTAQLENPRLIPQVILMPGTERVGELAARLRENQRWGEAGLVRYRSGQREVARWEEIAARSGQSDAGEQGHQGGVFRAGGVYLITGGGGGLGLLFAEEVARQAAGARIVLTGRSELNEEAARKLEQIRANGAEVEYFRVDVCDRKAVEEMAGQVNRRWGAIQGVIHSAGVIQDGFLMDKQAEELEAVLGPKVTGLVNLDEVLKDEKLEFFVMFSSGTGSWGNVGQGDYAAANGFMDAYARDRAGRVEAGERWGRTVSIGWPLWQDGGMKREARLVEQMREKLGTEPLASDRGLEAFYAVMASGRKHVAVVNGERKRLRETFLSRKPQQQPATRPSAPEPTRKQTTPDLTARVDHYFKTLLASVLKVSVDRIESDVPLDKYGLDSIISMQFVRELEKSFGTLSMTLLFEYRTVESLTQHFVKSYRSKLETLLEIVEQPVQSRDEEPMPPIDPAESIAREHLSPRYRREANRERLSSSNTDIAIIGMSGRYPQARNLAEFWENLKSGKDCITEIPSTRWDYRLYFDPEKGKPGKSYSKWGGFIDGVDEFDPMFFNISPREAELMDPQERLFLETVWALLENAGQTREALQIYEGRVGVYVGAMYQQYRAPASDLARHSVTSLASYSSIANRVSNFFDLRGPSIAVDTMCSSAALAIHLACKDLLSGECSLAIAGGVNLSLTPEKYSGLSQLNMIGSRFSSRSLSDGDGYLPAEAVGAALLKPLPRAIADGDRILAVIKGTATNHGGYSSGYSVPSLSQEAQLLEDLFRKSGIDPRSISYLEPSATGSTMADAIEFRALRKVFETQPGDNQYCAIGSVKSNIGHAEAASAMAQLSKITLQFQHGMLAPTIVPKTPNPDINFNDGPFALQLTLQEWKRPEIVINGRSMKQSRRALLNAFGAGGSNVSILLEEYEPPAQIAVRARAQSRPRVFIFSAQTKSALREQVEQMLDYVNAESELDLHDFAWTLQVGREAMPCRFAVVAQDRQELLVKITSFLKEHQDSSASDFLFFQGNAEEAAPILHSLLHGKSGELVIETLMVEKDWAKIAALWVQGAKIRWKSLYAHDPASLLPLPTYPFARERYWACINERTQENSPESIAANSKTTAVAVAESGQGSDVKDSLKHMVSEILMISLDRINTRGGLRSYGMDSIGSLKLRQRCESRFGVKISGKDLLALQNIEQLATYISSALPTRAEQLLTSVSSLPVMSGTTTAQVNGHESSIVAQKVRRPLSEGEKGLWLLQRLTPTMSSYNVPICFRAQGSFDVKAFHGACELALQRHPLLADVIVDEGGIPYRVIAPPNPRFFQQEDISTVDESSLLERLREKATKPIALSIGPMMRVFVLNRAKQETLILIVIHHISFDAGSIWPFLSQLLSDYSALANGKSANFKPSPFTYADFVAWEQKMLANAEGKNHIEYFRRTLQGMPSTLELPIDRPHPERPSFKGATRILHVPQHLRERIMRLSLAQGVTVSTVFLGMYQILLSRVSGQNDIIVGVSTVMRPDERFAELVGYFISTVPVRTVIHGSQLWSEFISDLDSELTEVLDHASYAFPVLVRNLKVKRPRGRHPIFQVAFTYQSLVSFDALHSLQEGKEAGLSIQFVPELRQEGEYELVLEVCEEAGGFLINFKYNCDLFDESTIAHLAECYEDLMKNIIADPNAIISTYSQMSDSALNLGIQQ